MRQMKSMQFIILVTIFGWCFSTTQVVGNDTSSAPTPADSIIVSNTVFSPNGDGGDGKFFEVRSSKGEDIVSLKVFNRSGTLIYSTNEKTGRWNGRSTSGEKAEKGMYYYVAQISEVIPKVTKTGAVTIQ